MSDMLPLPSVKLVIYGQLLKAVRALTIKAICHLNDRKDPLQDQLLHLKELLDQIKCEVDRRINCRLIGDADPNRLGLCVFYGRRLTVEERDSVCQMLEGRSDTRDGSARSSSGRLGA